MKKLFFIFVLVSCFAAGFAETGYYDTEWGTKRDRLDFGEKADEWKYGNITMVSFGTIILGDNSIKTYFFDKDKGLNCVGYFIPEGTLKELLLKFDSRKKVYEIQTELFKIEEIYEIANEIIKRGEEPQFYDSTDDAKIAFTIILAELYNYEIADITQNKGYKKLEKAKQGPGVGTLMIYDYNDDSRVYITTGNVENLAFVTYVPNFQDY